MAGTQLGRRPLLSIRRYDLYNATIDRLLDMGQAYHCHCSPETLEKNEMKLWKKGLKPKYDGTCRKLGLGTAPGSVVRLKTPPTGTTGFDDLVKGPIRFENEELDDLIIKRSNGSPTYHLAVVADDIDLGITHVIRGDDHVNNTPRQILIYKAWANRFPGIRPSAHDSGAGQDPSEQTSRRHERSGLPGDGLPAPCPAQCPCAGGMVIRGSGKISLEEMIEKFSLDHVGKSAGVFNTEKLQDLNAWYIRESAMNSLVNRSFRFLKNSGSLGRMRRF
jgi:glutamyl-tRNA synthetase